MSEPVAPALYLSPADLTLILQLLPRSQIVVGDIPRIYPTLQRLEAAVKAGSVFRQEVPSGAQEG